jgi:hypothetical protein
MLSGMYATLAIHGIAKAPIITADIGKTEQTQETTETMSLLKNPTKEEIKLALASISNKYGLNYTELYNVIECESGFDNTKIGDDGRSRGVAQFLQTTWQENCKGDYYSAYDQLICMAEMWNKKMQARWTCWRNLYKNN